MYRSPLVSNDRLRGLATESTTTCNAARFPSVVAPARAPGAAASRSVVTNARAERLCITEFLSFKRGGPRSCGERALSWWRIGGGTALARWEELGRAEPQTQRRCPMSNGVVIADGSFFTHE